MSARTIEVDEVLYESLVELFKAVADAYDGADELCSYVEECYSEIFKKPEVKKFYGDLIDNNPFNSLI